MYPHSHFLAGLTAGQVGVEFEYFNQSQAWLIALLAMLIDLDHYFYYCYKYKTLNFYKAWTAAITDTEKGERTAIHHWQGFLIASILIFFIALYDIKWALIMALAYYSHMLFDYLPLIDKRINFKILKLKFKLSYQEIIIDLLFIGVVIFLMFF